MRLHMIINQIVISDEITKIKTYVNSIWHKDMDENK